LRVRLEALEKEIQERQARERADQDRLSRVEAQLAEREEEVTSLRTVELPQIRESERVLLGKVIRLWLFLSLSPVSLQASLSLSVCLLGDLS
jgi:predicted nuclease with TOPRIM domain